MDHYTAEAYEKVRVRIVEHIDRLDRTGKTGSGDIHNVKNWRRFGAGFAWDPEVYMDILKNPDMPDAELMSSLRKTEGNLMKKWAVVDKMPMHHKIALRTGGDLGLRTPVNIWTETRARLYERLGFEPGNGPSNLNATSQFDERIHRWRDNAVGSPNSKAVSTPGLMEGLEKDNVVLHRKGQDLGNMPEQYMPLIGATSQQQADFLEEYIVNQVKRYDQAKGHFRTIAAEEALNDGVSWFLEDADGKSPNAFSKARTLEDQATIKSVLQAAEYNDPITGEIFSLDQLHGRGFVGTGEYSLDPQRLRLNFDTRKGKQAIKALKSSGGGLHLRSNLARQGVKSLKNVPTVLGGPLLAAAGLWVVGQDPTQAAVDATPLGDLEGGTELANIEAEGNYFVNRSNNEIVGERKPTMSTEEFRNQGRQGLAYKNGQPVAIPFGSSEVGEANTGDMLRAIKDEAWAVNTQRAADMKSYATGGANDYGFTELAERTVKRGIEWIKGGIPRFAITN